MIVWEVLTDRVLFSKKIFISPNVGKKGPKIKFFGFLKNPKYSYRYLLPISCLAKFWFLSYGSKYCWPVKLQDPLKCNIPRKKWMMKFIFGMQIYIEVFYKLIPSFWVCVAIHTQSTRNKKFIYISLQYLQENMEIELIFCLSNTNVLYKLILSF